MSAPLDPITTQETLYRALGKGKIYAPVMKPAAAGEVIFTGFGPDLAGGCGTGWSMIIDPASNARFLQACFTGVLAYEKSDGSSPNRLILINVDPIGRARWYLKSPAWFPFPRFAIYENVDEADLRSWAIRYLSDNEKIVAALREKALNNRLTPEQLGESFINGVLEGGLAVPAGAVIAKAGAAGSALKVDFYLQDELDNAAGVFIDPAIYPKHWGDYYADLAGHPLAPAFTTVRGGLKGNGRALYVKTGGTGTAPFASMSDPAGTLAAAYDAARDHDVIVILDDQEYEAGFEVAKSLTIMGASHDDAMDEVNGLPKLTCTAAANRVLAVKNLAGDLSLANLAIHGGRISSRTPVDVNDDSLLFCGAGLLVEKTDKTYVQNCRFSDNVVSRNEGGGPHGFGGAIFYSDSSGLVTHCFFTANKAIARGGAIGVWGLGWPVIEDCVFKMNKSTRDAADDNRADGGAIGTETAGDAAAWEGFWGRFDSDSALLAKSRSHYMVIEGCYFEENTSADDGGAVYLSTLCRALVMNCQFHGNEAGGSGGGLRVSYHSTAWVVNSTFTANRANLKGGRSNGGGIASKNSRLELWGTTVTDNTIVGFAGGGVSFYSMREEGPAEYNGSLLTGLPLYDAGTVWIFRPVKYFLGIWGSDNEISANHCTKLPASSEDHRVGGGLYVYRAPSFPTTSGTTMPYELEQVIPPLEIRISDLNTLSGNFLDPASDPSGAPLPPPYPHAVEMQLNDEFSGVLVDDAGRGGSYSPGGTEFNYP